MRVYYSIISLMVLSCLTLAGNAYSEGPKTVASGSAAKASASGTQNGDQTGQPAYTKEAQSVYEWCVGNRKASINIDCKCLTDTFTDMRSKRGPEPSKDILVLKISQNGCRNVPGTSRMEYARCMRGSGFKYYGIPPEDYCECYARTWGKLYGEFEGKIDEHKKSSMRFKARIHCKKPGAYKDK